MCLSGDEAKERSEMRTFVEPSGGVTQWHPNSDRRKLKENVDLELCLKKQGSLFFIEVKTIE